ncbi:hypothetical protein MBLNU459_g5697t1 [Dothideomycetes sp. NU459]
MSEINVVATIFPAEGKAERVFEVLSEVMKQVEANEPDTLRYQLLRQKDKPVFIFLETYKNGAALKRHGESPYFKQLVQTAQKENLFAKPTELVLCGAPVAGFLSRSSKL